MDKADKLDHTTIQIDEEKLKQDIEAKILASLKIDSNSTTKTIGDLEDDPETSRSMIHPTIKKRKKFAQENNLNKNKTVKTPNDSVIKSLPDESDFKITSLGSSQNLASSIEREDVLPGIPESHATPMQQSPVHAKVFSPEKTLSHTTEISPEMSLQEDVIVEKESRLQSPRKGTQITTESPVKPIPVETRQPSPQKRPVKHVRIKEKLANNPNLMRNLRNEALRILSDSLQDYGVRENDTCLPQAKYERIIQELEKDRAPLVAKYKNFTSIRGDLENQVDRIARYGASRPESPFSTKSSQLSPKRAVFGPEKAPSLEILPAKGILKGSNSSLPEIPKTDDYEDGLLSFDK
ncbi:Zinc finger protein dzip1 [Cichlidogyrus casuarinus]|uniref:Zinc finger protein dzip1 n=1 Tax=Cichlidogyrus casuarinus TaxID=1844966 RepID=A0ABD2QAN2_9PLAT